MSDLTINRGLDLLRAMSRRIDSLDLRLPSGKFVDYSPTLTASVTNPTLGTGAISPSGKWCRFGDLVYAMGDIRFGTAGAAAGSGNYQISLPAPAHVADYNTFTVLGHWRMTNGAGSSSNPTDILIANNATFMTCRYPLTWPTGTDTTVGAATPWAWSNNYRISFAVLYEAAP